MRLLFERVKRDAPRLAVDGSTGLGDTFPCPCGCGQVQYKVGRHPLAAPAAAAAAAPSALLQEPDRPVCYWPSLTRGCVQEHPLGCSWEVVYCVIDLMEGLGVKGEPPTR